MNITKKVKNIFSSNLKRYIYMCMMCALPFLCMSARCDDDHDNHLGYCVYLENESEDIIYVGTSENKGIISPADVFMHGEELPSLQPGERFEFVITGWKRVNRPGQYYQFIVFKKSTLENHDMREIIEKGIYDERYIFNFKELEQMNFIISFTGKNYEE